MLVIKYVIAQRYARMYSMLLKFSSHILAENGHLTNCGAKVRKKTDICKRVAIFFAIEEEKMQFCCGGGVPECHSGERKEEWERREIDQAWSIYGGSEEPMSEYDSGIINEERERREIDQIWSIYGGSEEPMPEWHSGEMNEDKDRKTGTGKTKRKRDR